MQKLAFHEKCDRWGAVAYRYAINYNGQRLRTGKQVETYSEAFDAGERHVQKSAGRGGWRSFSDPIYLDIEARLQYEPGYGIYMRYEITDDGTLNHIAREEYQAGT